VIELGAVLDEETVHAGELVGLGRQHHDVEVEVGEICTGQLETPGIVGVIDVDHAGHLVRDALFKSLPIDSESSSVLRGAS
jgi:hypothetical protein